MLVLVLSFTNLDYIPGLWRRYDTLEFHSHSTVLVVNTIPGYIGWTIVQFLVKCLTMHQVVQIAGVMGHSSHNCNNLSFPRSVQSVYVPSTLQEE